MSDTSALTKPLMQVFSTLFSTDDNALVAAPTGSGKTMCAEFAILHMVARHEEKVKERDEDGSVAVPPLRAVYVASKAAIIKEKYRDWNARFGATGLGLNVVQLTGELQVRASHQCSSSQN